MYEEPSPWFAAAVVALYVGVWARERWREWRGPDNDLEAAREEYAAGEITHAEFERRAELALDEDADRIRDAVERVDGVGPETSASIALRFDTFDEVREASAKDLEEIHGVGPSTAEAIRRRF